jgi:hypothetical protein
VERNKPNFEPEVSIWESPSRGWLSSIVYIFFRGRIRSSAAAMGGGGAQRPCFAEAQKTGSRSARARTRGQNPLVLI